MSKLSASERDHAAAVIDDGGVVDDLIARVRWSVLTEPGDGIAGALRDRFGAVEAMCCVARGEDAVDMAADAGISHGQWREALARWSPRNRPDAVAEALDRARRAGMRLAVPGSATWPEGVDDLGPHAPHLLWIRSEGGSTDLLRNRSIAVVGARAASAYGEHVAGELAEQLGMAGWGVISGAAYGIDGAAHRAALGTPGGTVAVLAGGADRVYPAGHAHLLAQIVREGAVIAECPPGTTPSKWRFLARNRLIAAISSATVVVEAGPRSGSLNTAGHAASLGRPLGAVPGPVTASGSVGCHRLIREYGAECITSSADIRELVGELDMEAEVHQGRSDPAMIRTRDALDRRVARTVDALAAECGMSLDAVQAALGALSLSGEARRSGEGWLLCG